VIPLFPHKPALWIISSVAVAAAAALWVWQQRRKPMTAVSFTGLSTGLALYLPSLLGATFESGDPFVATRYVHLVLLGLLISVAPLLQKPLTRRYQVVVGAIVISCLAFSYVRIREWRSEVSFFSAEHRAFPESHTVWHNLLNAQIKAGLYDDAILTIHDYTQRKQALTRTEESIRLHTLSRIALERDRNMVLATDLAHRALLDNPADLLLLFNLVEIRAAAGHPEESLIFLQRALSSSLYSPRQRQVIEMNLERLEQMMASRHNTSSGGTPSP
jgi:hypothetical protein